MQINHKDRTIRLTHTESEQMKFKIFSLIPALNTGNTHLKIKSIKYNRTELDTKGRYTILVKLKSAKTGNVFLMEIIVEKASSCILYINLWKNEIDKQNWSTYLTNFNLNNKGLSESKSLETALLELNEYIETLE